MQLLSNWHVRSPSRTAVFFARDRIEYICNEDNFREEET